MFPEITRNDIFRLETERLWLRWPRAADAEAITRGAGDPDVALKTATIPYPYAVEHAEQFIREVRTGNAAGERLTLVLALKRQPNEVIGAIGAEGAPYRGATSYGYWLAKPHWGQGLMTEASIAFIDLTFAITSLQEIIASALPENIASLRVQEKIGFVVTGEKLVDRPARDGPRKVVTTLLKRGAARGVFGPRRAQLAPI